jgi:hypothetical protein
VRSHSLKVAPEPSAPSQGSTWKAGKAVLRTQDEESDTNSSPQVPPQFNAASSSPSTTHWPQTVIAEPLGTPAQSRHASLPPHTPHESASVSADGPAPTKAWPPQSSLKA